MMDERTRTVLRGAKGIVARGWWQGTMCNEAHDRFCIMGAIHKAADCRLDITDEATDLVWRTLDPAMRHATTDGLVHPLAVWNDTRGRTQAEVVALFDKALTADPAPVETSVAAPPVAVLA